MKPDSTAHYVIKMKSTSNYVEHLETLEITELNGLTNSDNQSDLIKIENNLNRIIPGALYASLLASKTQKVLYVILSTVTNRDRKEYIPLSDSRLKSVHEVADNDNAVVYNLGPLFFAEHDVEKN